MSKLSFRARALDPSKPMPIYLAEELPDLPEYSAINRAVPQMPSGMEKEEESEHHLQRAICTGLIIPTPEVYDSTDSEFYDKYYPPDYKLPKQLIHMQPLNLEQDIPDYDMDSADEVWVTSHEKKLDLDPLKFEIMMDRLEKSSGQTVVTLNEAKALLKQDDEVSIAVYDYWLNKRLKLQHPLILYVKTENRGNMTPNNPYLAFRRRTEKMQTRKNRKNDESSYEKMLKLRRDLSRAVTLLDMIKRREKLKREQLHLSIEIYEKRYQAQDFHGHLLSEFTSNATRVTRPAFAPIYTNQYAPLGGQGGVGQGANAVVGAGGAYLNSGGSSSQYEPHGTGSTGTNKRDNESLSSRKEKRQYTKRKLKMQKDRGLASGAGSGAGVAGGRGDGAGALNSTSGLGSSGLHGHHQQQQHHHYHGSMLGGIGGRGVDGTVVGGHGTDHHHHLHGSGDHAVSSDDEELSNLQGSSAEEEYAYAFRRSKHSQYHRPRADGYGNWPWTSREENGSADPRYRFTLTSLRYPRPRCIGFARRRLGRGGRVIIDRIATDFDDLWSRLDYTIVESETIASALSSSEPTIARDDVQEDENNEPIVIPCRRRQIERTVSVSSNCSNTSSSAGVVVSLKPPPRIPAAMLNHQNPPLVNGSDGLPLTNGGDGITSRTTVSRRKLILKQEPPAMSDYESDGPQEIQFLASIGLMNKAEKDSTAASDELSAFASTKRRLRFDSEEKEGESGGGEVAKSEGVVCDERTLKANVPNSDSIVIKSEDNATGAGTELVVMSTGRIKQEPDVGGAVEDYQKASVPVGEDFEQLIDSVNNHTRTRFNVTTTTTTSTVTEASSNSISSTVNNGVSGLPNSTQQSQPEGGSPSRLHDATPEDINAVYKDLLNDIQSNWLHFRPKTPEPSQDDLLTWDGEEDELMEPCLGLTDRHRITLELQSLDEPLPGTIFTPGKGTTLSSLFRTTPYDLDSLIEPHPLSLEEGGDLASPAAKAATTGSSSVEVKLETSGSSASGENNLSVPSELNLSLNESNEDNEKMLDNILQECAIDDPKQLHQTSNFWNGILDDGMLNNLETSGGQAEDEPMVEDSETSEARNLFSSSSAKIGYHSELVGYGRPSGAADRRTSKSKRRKMLKRCRYLVGSSYFSVKSLPKEEIFQPLLDANGQPIVLSYACLDLDSSVDPMSVGGEQSELRDSEDTAMQGDSLRSGTLGGGVEAMEIKMEEDTSSSLVAAAVGTAEESVSGEPLIKIEPPDELVAAAATDTTASCDATLLGNTTPTTVQFLPHNSTTMAAPAATTIKLEPFNHISQIAARSSTPDGARVVPTGSTTLIPATIVVSQPSSSGNSSMFQTTSGTVPAVVSVSLQQGSLHQLVHTSSAPSMGAGTTMLVMQSIPSVQSSPSASVAGTPTSFLLSNAGSNTGSILVQTSASSSLSNNAVQSSSSSSTNSLLSASTPIVVTVPPASSSGLSAAQPISGTNTVVSVATPIVVSSSSAASLAQSIVHAQSQAASSAVSNSSSGSSSTGTTTALNSYIVQHNSTPIMLSHQQMQQLANSGGGNIVTVGGQQVVTTKQHHGETFVLTQTPLKKQINGPSDGNKNATTSAVNAQNINNQKFHALLSHKLGSKPSDLNKKQLEMIRKALGSSQKMFVKSTNHGQQLHAGTASGSAGIAGHHQQSSPQQQQQQYNVIHQNSLNTPITIVSAQSPGQPTQNKIILTSSPHLLQQATAVGGATAGQLIAASHGKIQLTTVQQGQQQQQTGQVTTGAGGGQILTLDPSGSQQGGGGVSGVQQQLKLEKNRILYNIKNSRGQFLHLNPKMVNIIQPVQQQKIVNSLTIQQQQQAQQQQQLLHNQAGHGGTTTILSKGQTVQRIPTVSIRTQQQQQQAQQQQQGQQQTNLVDMVVVNNANNIKFIQAAASAAAAAAAGGNVVNNSTATSRVNSVTTSGTLNASSSDSGTSSSSSSSNSSGSNCVQVATLSTSVANSVGNSAGGPLTNSSSSNATVASVASVTSTTAGTAGTVVGGGGGSGSSNGSGGSGAVTGSTANTNPSASINITNR